MYLERSKQPDHTHMICPFCKENLGIVSIEIIVNFIIQSKLVCLDCVEKPEVIVLYYFDRPKKVNIGIDLSDEKDFSVESEIELKSNREGTDFLYT